MASGIGEYSSTSTDDIDGSARGRYINRVARLGRGLIIATLHLLEPGLYTLLVDRGRPSARSLGVPVGGAADRISLAIGNALVGNAPDVPALEISLVGPTLQVDSPLACVLYGAPLEMHSDRQRVAPGKTFTLAAGETLTIGGTLARVRGYFCVAGGFGAAPVLGSCSSGEPLRAGATLSCSSSAIQTRYLREKWDSADEAGVLRVLDGSQVEWFRLEEFLGPPFLVTPASNRMGLRLSGAPLTLPARELTSEPVCPGAVQVTRDGQCIVLGVDGQTIGGYPKIAHVISADLDRLGQLRPGEMVRFRQVSMEEAEEAYHEQVRKLREWTTYLRAAEVWGR